MTDINNPVVIKMYVAVKICFSFVSAILIIGYAIRKINIICKNAVKLSEGNRLLLIEIRNPILKIRMGMMNSFFWKIFSNK